MKIDSGATSHFYDSYKSALLSTPTSKTNPSINVLIPNGHIMKSMCTAKLPIPQLPLTASQAQGFKHLASGSLLSVGQHCDHNCSAIFDKDKVRIYKTEQVTILPRAPPILTGHRNAQDKLWSVRLNPPTHPSSTPSKQCANAIIKTHPNLPQRIAFYHGALFSPVLTTWIKAQRNHNLDSWPALSTKQIAKYGPNPEATVKGHKQALCKNIQSTKKHMHPELPLSFGAAAANVEE